MRLCVQSTIVEGIHKLAVVGCYGYYKMFAAQNMIEQHSKTFRFLSGFCNLKHIVYEVCQNIGIPPNLPKLNNFSIETRGFGVPQAKQAVNRFAGHIWSRARYVSEIISGQLSRLSFANCTFSMVLYTWFCLNRGYLQILWSKKISLVKPAFLGHPNAFAHLGNCNGFSPAQIWC